VIIANEDKVKPCVDKRWVNSLKHNTLSLVLFPISFLPLLLTLCSLISDVLSSSLDGLFIFTM